MHTIHATSIIFSCRVAALLLGLLTVLPASADPLAVATAGSAQTTRIAQPRIAQQDSAQQSSQARSVTIINVTAAQAARSARHEYGGKVLGVRLEQADNKPPFYRVRLISRGRVHVVSVNAHK